MGKIPGLIVGIGVAWGVSFIAGSRIESAVQEVLAGAVPASWSNATWFAVVGATTCAVIAVPALLLAAAVARRSGSSGTAAPAGKSGCKPGCVQAASSAPPAGCGSG